MVDPSPIKRSKMMCLPLEEIDYKNRTFILFSHRKPTANFLSYSLLRQRLGNRNGNGDGHADHRVVAQGTLGKSRTSEPQNFLVWYAFFKFRLTKKRT